MKNTKIINSIFGIIAGLLIGCCILMIMSSDNFSNYAADDVSAGIVVLAPDLDTEPVVIDTTSVQVATTTTANITSTKITSTVSKASITTTTVKPIETKVSTIAKINEVQTEQDNSESYQIDEYVIYKPETHYIHKNTCRWAKTGNIQKIDNTEGIEVRKCTECSPEMEIITEYIPPVQETIITNNDDRELLAQIVWHEAGSSWISQYNKAKIAAGVMNRVNDSRFPNTVYGVLTQKGQFTGFWPYCCTATQDCYDAVDYYFSHIEEFNGDNSWYGDGRQNHFYYQ